MSGCRVFSPVRPGRRESRLRRGCLPPLSRSLSRCLGPAVFEQGAVSLHSAATIILLKFVTRIPALLGPGASLSKRHLFIFSLFQRLISLSLFQVVEPVAGHAPFSGGGSVVSGVFARVKSSFPGLSSRAGMPGKHFRKSSRELGARKLHKRACSAAIMAGTRKYFAWRAMDIHHLALQFGPGLAAGIATRANGISCRPLYPADRGIRRSENEEARTRTDNRLLVRINLLALFSPDCSLSVFCSLRHSPPASAHSIWKKTEATLVRCCRGAGCIGETRRERGTHAPRIKSIAACSGEHHPFPQFASRSPGLMLFS